MIGGGWWQRIEGFCYGNMDLFDKVNLWVENGGGADM